MLRILLSTLAICGVLTSARLTADDEPAMPEVVYIDPVPYMPAARITEPAGGLLSDP
jgi:hypothetical protein